MKKIRPVGRYDEDRGYPSTRSLETEPDNGEPFARRSFLKGLLAGAAAVGTGLWFGARAQAQSKPPKPPKPHLPGKPPRPDPRPGPRPRETPPVPGGGPIPTPQPTTRPCGTPVARVKLDTVYNFCDDRVGELKVTTADPAVARMLRKPGEGRRLAPVLKAVFAQEKSCGWIDHPLQKAGVEARLAKALTESYQQAMGTTIEPLKVQLIVHSRPIRPGGVMRRPDPPRPPRRGCASCSTNAGLQDGLLPAGLVALALLVGKLRTK